MQNAAELLMPVGSLEKLKVAILYGADAVYMGTPGLSLRTRSNLTLEEVLEGVAFAHAHGKRAHLRYALPRLLPHRARGCAGASCPRWAAQALPALARLDVFRDRGCG